MRRAGAKRQPCMLAACMRRPPAHVPPQLRATAPAQEVARATYAPSPPSKMPGTTHQAAGGGASMAGQRDGPRGEWGREKEKERVRARARRGVWPSRQCPQGRARGVLGSNARQARVGGQLCVYGRSATPGRPLRERKRVACEQVSEAAEEEKERDHALFFFKNHTSHTRPRPLPSLPPSFHTSSSAICTAFRAAPFLIWSPHTNRSSPLPSPRRDTSPARGRRRRHPCGRVQRGGEPVGRPVVDDGDAREGRQGRQGGLLGSGALKLQVDGFGVRAHDRHAHARGRDGHAVVPQILAVSLTSFISSSLYPLAVTGGCGKTG